MNLKIAWLYPDLMSTYGDRGNVITLTKRCQWRGIEAEIVEITLESDTQALTSSDLIFMGGAQDRQQKIASEDLFKNKGPVIKEMVENRTPSLFVCAAYQFMGHYYHPAEGDDIPGLGIFDLYTKHFGKNRPRCIGNIVAKMEPEIKVQGDNTIVGFENHGGRTYLGKKVQPLAKVIKGFGNNGEDETEGAIYKNVIGSYLHGPLLPKNPHLADYLLELALCKKYEKEIKLPQLEDSLEWQAHQKILQKLSI